MISFFHFPIGGGYPIWWGVLRFRFQNSISIFKFSSRPASPNVVLVYIISIIYSRCYILHATLYIYHTTYSHPFILCYIIYVYIIYLHTFFRASFHLSITLFQASYSCIIQSSIYAKIAFAFFFIALSRATICCSLNTHLITFCSTYILCIF